MKKNISHLLPNSIPTQNNHRLIIVNAEAEPDEFSRLEAMTADVIAYARTASKVGEAMNTNGNRAFHYALSELADHVAKRRVLSNAFRENVAEVLRHLDTASEDHSQNTTLGMRDPLKQAITLSLRVTDLLAAERDVGWHRGIRQE